MPKRQSNFYRKSVIFSTFLLLCSAVAAAESVRSSENVMIDFADGYADRRAAAAYIKDMDQLMSRTFGAKEGSRALPCRIELNDRSPYRFVESSLGKDGFLLKLGGPFSHWRRDILANRRLFGAILLCKFGIVPQISDRLPGWLYAGLSGRIRAKESASLLRRSRYLPGLRFLVKHRAMPELHDLILLDPECMTPEIRVVYEDVCRFIMELGYASDRRGTVLRDYVLTERSGTPLAACRASFDRAFLDMGRRFAAENAVSVENWSDAEIVRYFLRRCSEPAAFNQTYCYEPDSALARFREFRKVAVPVEGKPEPRLLDLAELPKSELSDAQKKLFYLCKQKELALLRSSFNDHTSKATGELEELLKEIDGIAVWRATGKLESALKEVEDAFLRDIARDRFTDSVLEREFSPVLRLRHELSVARESDREFTTRAVKAFTDKVERQYATER